MRHRHAISDDDWARIKDLPPGQPGQHGKVAKDNRLFVDAVLWIARTGAPWRDLPERLGNWNSAWRRFLPKPREAVAEGARRRRMRVAWYGGGTRRVETTTGAGR